MCSAALCNVRIAAAARQQLDVRLLSTPGQPLLLAEIRLAAGIACPPVNVA